MIARRLVLSTILLAGFGTACTAIVLGKVGDTGDYKTVPVGSTGSSLDECSLVKGDYYAADRDANACSTCIETKCATDVAFACNAGDNKSPKPWFKTLKDCAKDPWNGEKPPSEPSGGFGYECEVYEKEVKTISDNGSDTERDLQSQSCVHTNCMQGTLPPCKMCEISIKKSASDAVPALLREDPCGSCLVENCQETLVRCCDTGGVDDFVKRCAYTKLDENRALCLELGKEVPDAGKGSYTSYGDAGGRCLDDIRQCFRQHCAILDACKP